MAPYGSQTNFSYDEQVDFADAHCLRFHAVIHSVLLKYIACNIRDATASTTLFRVDDNAMEQSLGRCLNMTQLLDQHRAFQTRMTADFERAAQRQENVATNTLTLGQYIRYIESCDATKLKNAMNRQNDEIQKIDGAISENQRQIEELLEQQRQLKVTHSMFLRLEMLWFSKWTSFGMCSAATYFLARNGSIFSEMTCLLSSL